MGIADAFDIGWKLASVINGSGGAALLQSYEMERKPVAARNVAHSGVHFQVHMGLKDLLTSNGTEPHCVDDDTTEARDLRSRIRQYYQEHDGENKDFGIEMDYRYQSHVIVSDEAGSEPAWTPSGYTPTTWPGSRPPHLFLNDGSAIFDHFGQEWTLLNFSCTDSGCGLLEEAARDMSVPLIKIDFYNEQLAKKLYERKLVLLRPDQHVAWRADHLDSLKAARDVFETVTGRVDTIKCV